MDIMNSNNYLNEITSDADYVPESISIYKLVIVYGSLFCAGAYNLINAISSIILSFPQDFRIKPGNIAMIKWAVFDVVSILLYIFVAFLCAVAFKAVIKNAKNLETLVTSPFAIGFLGYTIKSVMYREFFHTVYKMHWQNFLFITVTLGIIVANLIYLNKDSIYETLSSLINRKVG